MTWRYYLFFFLGTIAKKHFETFLQLISRKTTLAAFGIGFALLASLSQTDNLMIGYLVFAGGGMMGTTIVFAFFRTFASWFSHTHILGSALQYIGTHTLDIYLLHYFFLPRFLLPYGPQLKAYESPFLELATGLLLAVVITAISLLASRIIRLSPFLAHYLFGAQNPSKQRHPLQ
jgi:multidrug transporter EmrE-like cation transporter